MVNPTSNNPLTFFSQEAQDKIKEIDTSKKMAVGYAALATVAGVGLSTLATLAYIYSRPTLPTYDQLLKGIKLHLPQPTLGIDLTEMFDPALPPPFLDLIGPNTTFEVKGIFDQAAAKQKEVKNVLRWIAASTPFQFVSSLSAFNLLHTYQTKHLAEGVEKEATEKLKHVQLDEINVVQQFQNTKAALEMAGISNVDKLMAPLKLTATLILLRKAGVDDKAVAQAKAVLGALALLNPDFNGVLKTLEKM